jgi:hypothetical protein
MANAGLTGFLTGAVKGYDQAMEDNRIKAREERDTKRFEWERADNERRLKMQQESDAATKEYQQSLDDFNNMRGDFAKYAHPDAIQQQAPAQAGQQPQAAIAAPAQGADVAAQSQPQQAIGGGQAPTQAPATDGDQPNKATVDAEKFLRAPMQYKDVRGAEDLLYKKQGDALKKSYLARGEIGKAAMVDTEMAELREKQYEPARRNAAAAALMGASPEALQPLLEKTYGAWKDGKDVKVDSVKVDPKTQQATYGLTFVDKATGKSVSRDFTGMQLYGILQTENAFNAAKTNVELKIKQQSADAETTKAGAYATMAIDNAATNRTQRAANTAIASRQQDLREDEAAQRTFGSAFGVKDFTVKTSDEVKAMMPTEREGYEKARVEHARRASSANDAYNIFQINQRAIPASEIVAALPKLQERLASGKGADGIDEKSGLPYVIYNGKKMLLPKE